jgi:hypothetical protein
MFDEVKAPGLQWAARQAGKRVPYWVARPDLIKQGYRPKSVRLHYDDPSALIARCHELQAEMMEWAGGGRQDAAYDGKLSTLVRMYQTDKGSPYRGLHQNTQRNYTKAIEWLATRLNGDPRVRDISGADAREWFLDFCETNTRGWAAYVLAVFKAAIAYGSSRKFKDCLELSASLRTTRLGTGQAREQEMTYEHLVAFREAAHRLGRPSAALWTTFQYELGLRRRDVIGEWVNVTDPTTGTMIKQWRDGLTWSSINDNGVLTKQLSKTRFKTGVKVEHQIANYPELVAELKRIPPEKRDPLVPIVINESTGLPYTPEQCREYFRVIARAAGIPDEVQNRDARAGFATEADAAGADQKDTMIAGGWTQQKTLNKHYVRKRVEQTSRVAKLRIAHRQNKQGENV